MATDRRKDDERLTHLETLAEQATEDHLAFRNQLSDLAYWRASVNSRLSALELREDRMLAALDERHEENQTAIHHLTEAISEDRNYTRDTLEKVNVRLGQNNEALARMAGGWGMFRWGIGTLIAALSLLAAAIALAGKVL